MAPCLSLLKSIFSQPDTSDDQEQWKNLLATIKSNKLTLTETPVSSLQENLPRRIWLMADVKINKETGDRAFGTAMLKRRYPGMRSENSDEEAQFHIVRRNLGDLYLAEVVVLAGNREMRLVGEPCLNCPRAGVNIAGTSIRRVPEMLVRGELSYVTGGVYVEDKNTAFGFGGAR
jgi:hypothetical protein